ncbi:MAG: peptidase [Kiritimatiellae bacterium]|nr:peptidase [Kiritimatiellia bacterium]
MRADLDSIVQRLPVFRDAAEGMREVVLAHLAMIGDVPSQTFHESARVERVLSRFSDAGMSSCSMDEMTNGLGCLPGDPGDRTLLVVSNADSLAEEDYEPRVQIDADQVIGPYVGDNSLALAVLASMPTLLERLGIRLRSNVMFLAASRALGRGNQEGLKFFLDHASPRCDIGLCVEGVQLGRLNYVSLGMARADVVVRLPDDYDWVKFGSTGTILPMAEIVRRMGHIPMPRRPLTSMVIGSVAGGIGHQNIARETTLGFELRSESSELLEQMLGQIKDITEDVAARAGLRVFLDVFARREPGALDIGHPLVCAGRAILGGLGINPMLYPSTSSLSAFLDRSIPAVTIGLSSGERRSDLAEIEEVIRLPTLYTGMAQLVGLLCAMDEESADVPA